jgi:hypothetical protein
VPARSDEVSIVILGVLAILAIAGVALVELVIRRTDVGATLVLAIMLLNESSLFDLYVMAGSVRLTINDLLFGVLLTAAIARLLRLGRLSVPQRLLILFGVLVLWALARGFEPAGVPAAVNQARRFLLFGASAMYFSTVEPQRDLLDRIGRFWLIAATVLCGFTLLRWIGSFAGVSNSFIEGAYGDGDSLRAIPAIGALIIAQAAWIALPLLADRSRGVKRFLSPVFFVFVLLLQHRTVWVLTVAGTLYLLFRERAIATRVLAALAAATVLFAGLVFTLFDEADSQVSEQLATSAQSTGTFEWRVEGWAALLKDQGPENLEEVLVGRPFGLPWDRVMPNGRVASVSPHSFYVEPYLRVGLIGLAALLLTYAFALRGTLVASREEDARGLLSPALLHTVIAVQLLFFITYTPDAAQALLLGLGCAVAIGHRSMLGSVSSAVKVPE